MSHTVSGSLWPRPLISVLEKLRLEHEHNSFFEAGFPYLVCGYIRGLQCRIFFPRHCVILTSGLTYSFRKIISKHICYFDYLRQDSQIRFVDTSWFCRPFCRMSHTVYTSV